MVVFERNGKKYELVFSKYGPYIRRFRYDADIRKASPKRRESVRLFAVNAMRTAGQRGFKIWRGRRLPVTSAEVGKNMYGIRIPIESLTDKERKRLQLLKEAFGVEGEDSPSLLRRLKARLQLMFV